MNLYHYEQDHLILHGDSVREDFSELAPDGYNCTLITDPPYGDRTHSGHAHALPGARRDLDYRSWSRIEVHAAVEAWRRFVGGWWVILTDHNLAPAWERSLMEAGLYVFAPLPALIPGSRVRMQGDGPSCWTCWIVVARPKVAPFCKWGTLPGGYTGKPERQPVVGGKPEWLMRALIRDYSKPGDVILDPCCGGGTTLRAAKDMGRKSVGIDINKDHCRISAERLKQGSLFRPAVQNHAEKQLRIETDE